MNLQQRYITALQARGCEIVTNKSYKHVTMTDGNNIYYFVGKSGALRVGFGSNVTNSLTCSEKFKNSLLGKDQHEPATWSTLDIGRR